MTAEYRLGPDAYTDDAWFRREQRQIIGDTWTLVAWTDDLAEPGDYVAATIGDSPIVVTRGEDGELRALHNLCRHRGMVMLEGAGNTGSEINCPYHHWRYALDGDLRRVPQRKEQFPDLDVACWGMLPASVDEWIGMVFVHPDPAAAPLATYLDGFPAAMGTFRPDLLQPVGRELVEARCNWKLFVENHVDVYHLWHLHEESLGDLDHTKFEHSTSGGHWVSYEPFRDAATVDGRHSSGTALIDHIDAHDRGGVGAHLIFPNQMFATSAMYFAAYRAVPVAPDRSIIDIRVRAQPGADADVVMKSVHSFIDEDVYACEAVQAGVRSPQFTVGPLARTHELPITLFQEHLLSRLEG